MSSRSIAILVGTTKGAFLISGGSDRSGWAVEGSFCDGWPINHIIGDPASGTIWAAGGSDWHGAGVWRSDDGGKSWEVTRLTKGTMDEWAAKDADFAAMIHWTEEALPFGDDFSRSGRSATLTAHCMREPNRQACWRAATVARAGKSWKA